MRDSLKRACRRVRPGHAYLYILFSVTLTQIASGQSDLDTRFDALRRDHEAAIERVRRDYEVRIQSLEAEVRDLRTNGDGVSGNGALETLVNDLERQGLDTLGQTTVFDARFNPAIGVVGDFVLALSDRDDAYEQFDRFHLRGVEMTIVGEVDPGLAYYVAIHVDEEDFELEEAYGDLHDFLPFDLDLRFGRMNVDFGRQSSMHEHELPTVDKPGVIQDYLGGSLRGTGIELNRWSPLGDSHLLRYSVGVYNSPDGDAHAIAGPLAGGHGHEEHSEDFEFGGERGFGDFSYSLRLTALLETSSQSTLQIGMSLVWAPGVRTILEDPMDPDTPRRFDLERLVAGFDLEYRQIDPATGRGFTIGTEVLLNHSEYADDLNLRSSRNTAVGAYGVFEYHFDRRWSIGGSVDWFEDTEQPQVDVLDAGIFATWQVNEFHRLRAELRWFDDLAGDDGDFLLLMLQWTTVIGSHGHGLRW